MFCTVYSSGSICQQIYLIATNLCKKVNIFYAEDRTETTTAANFNNNGLANVPQISWQEFQYTPVGTTLFTSLPDDANVISSPSVIVPRTHLAFKILQGNRLTLILSILGVRARGKSSRPTRESSTFCHLQLFMEKT